MMLGSPYTLNGQNLHVHSWLPASLLRTFSCSLGILSTKHLLAERRGAVPSLFFSTVLILIHRRRSKSDSLGAGKGSRVAM